MRVFTNLKLDINKITSTVVLSAHQPLVGHIRNDDTPPVVIPGQPKAEPGIHAQAIMDPGFKLAACPGMTASVTAESNFVIRRSAEGERREDLISAFSGSSRPQDDTGGVR